MSTDAASATSVPADLCARYGPTALVVGAGAGLGAAYSAQLAAAGFDLILVDRDASALDAVAADLSCATQTLVVDLAEDGAAATIATAALDDGTVGLVVANAAASYVGAFADQPPGSIDAVLGVNVATTTDLVHRLVPHLRARPSSGLILMSSQSSRRGAPLVAVYAATKAYVTSLTESLHEEVKSHGVHVTALCPGLTKTEFQSVSNTEQYADEFPEIAWTSPMETMTKFRKKAAMRVTSRETPM